MRFIYDGDKVPHHRAGTWPAVDWSSCLPAQYRYLPRKLLTLGTHPVLSPPSGSHARRSNFHRLWGNPTGCLFISLPLHAYALALSFYIIPHIFPSNTYVPICQCTNSPLHSINPRQQKVSA
jgi:hypothetical protein